MGEGGVSGTPKENRTSDCSNHPKLSIFQYFIISFGSLIFANINFREFRDLSIFGYFADIKFRESYYI